MIISIYIIFSALLGSFLASFIYRYVNKNIEADSYVESINIYTEPSFCPACKTKIDWYHLIPILSYLFLGGKAKCCGATISSRYFLIEILVIFLFLLIFITNDNVGLIFLKSLITLNLIFIALIDHKHKVIPLSSLLLLTIFAIVLSQQTNILNLSELFVALISGLILLSL
jgi:prepilin signal peptidase PulO-like enzyme (type II secretory pathway)